MALLALLALLAFLFPIAVYCLFLALINRRPFPVVATGRWDAAGLIFACSGFLLTGGPFILTALYHKNLIDVPGDTEPVSFEELWLRYWLVWVFYYFALSAGTVLLFWLRQNKTIIYNVDADLFGSIFPRMVAAQGYGAIHQQGRWLIVPASTAAETAEAAQALEEGNGVSSQPSRRSTAPPLTAPVATEAIAEVEVDLFSALCHVTLHWRAATPEFQRDFERRLRQHVTWARTDDNPVGNWFLVVAGLLFGVLFVLSALVGLIILRLWW